MTRHMNGACNVRVLVAEDDDALREAIAETLRLTGYSVRAVRHGREAIEALAAEPASLLLSDVQMPELDGLALLKEARHRYPQLPVVMMTAYGNIPDAVRAMRDGAVDYLTKPFDPEILVHMVARHARVDEPTGSDAPVCGDARTRALVALVERVAVSEATVLLSGESGTGKEVYARHIHRSSARAARPFVAINCAAIPDNMLEAVLFGYEKGAYTGAHQSSPGKFEQAQGGTLLLDEISEMPLTLQAKLLRVLQEREVERLGGRKPVPLDVRVLATTNRDLRACVAEGRFRGDLYYRLNVFPIAIPPLRERPGDILPLARALLAREAGRESGRAPAIEPAAEARLMAHVWPGNVRELGNTLQRAQILCANGVIREADLAFEPTAGGNRAVGIFESAHEPVDDEGLRAQERRLILDTLAGFKGSRTRTAERLGISERTLRYKLARLRDAGVALPGREVA